MILLHTSSEAMEVLNLKASQTRQILREMAERNLLEAEGKNRNRYYVLFTENPSESCCNPQQISESRLPALKQMT